MSALPPSTRVASTECYIRDTTSNYPYSSSHRILPAHPHSLMMSTKLFRSPLAHAHDSST